MSATATKICMGVFVGIMVCVFAVLFDLKMDQIKLSEDIKAVELRQEKIIESQDEWNAQHLDGLVARSCSVKRKWLAVLEIPAFAGMTLGVVHSEGCGF